MNYIIKSMKIQPLPPDIDLPRSRELMEAWQSLHANSNNVLGPCGVGSQLSLRAKNFYKHEVEAEERRPYQRSLAKLTAITNS